MIPKIGTISTRPHHPADVLPALTKVWQQYYPSLAATSLPENPAREWYETGAAHDAIFDLIDDINLALPFGLYCGWHAGPPSELGIWPDTRAIKTAKSDGDLTILPSSATIFDITATDSKYALIYSTNGTDAVMLGKRDDDSWTLLWQLDHTGRAIAGQV